ncbi:PREDICTED: proline-rich protein HaeIII subfamily 1-like [Nipponia nippon]|uniref:proline-rich protein HaeIII subfamily 1-like n=1 Tax=Nipponia nippon TaxID=128390 RepID=UPI0005112FEB|nr:PREDICTED: proline-rich protein HaeIII subfamily 1-like [Nipponia nippon]
MPGSRDFKPPRHPLSQLVPRTHLGSWCWERPARSRAAPRGTQEPSKRGASRQRAPGLGLPPAGPPMVGGLPPTPSPTSRLRPGPPPKQAPAAQPGGRVREPAAPARAWRQPRPNGTEPPRRDLGVRTPSGDLPKTTPGMPSPGGHWLSLPRVRRARAPLPPRRESSRTTQGELPNPPHGPAPAASAPTPAPGSDEAATAQLLPACGGSRGRTRREGGGKGQDADGTMQLPAQVAGGGRTRGCLRPQLRLPSAGEGDDGPRSPRRRGRGQRGRGEAEPLGGSQPRRGLAGRVTPRKLPWFSAPHAG